MAIAREENSPGIFADPYTHSLFANQLRIAIRFIVIPQPRRRVVGRSAPSDGSAGATNRRFATARETVRQSGTAYQRRHMS